MAFRVRKYRYEDLSNMVQAFDGNAMQLYQDLMGRYPNLTFVLVHDETEWPKGDLQKGMRVEMFFNNPDEGEHGYVILDGEEHPYSSLGVDFPDYADHPFIEWDEEAHRYRYMEFPDGTNGEDKLNNYPVPIHSFGGWFANFVAEWPSLHELEGKGELEHGVCHPVGVYWMEFGNPQDAELYVEY